LEANGKVASDARIDVLERENRLTADEVSHLQTRLKAVTGELQDARSIITGLDADRESLERVAREKTIELERAQRQLEDSLKSMTLGSAEQRTFQREVEAVNREKDALARERDAILREKSAVEKQKELAESEVAMLRKRNYELESENSSLKRGSNAAYSYGQPYMVMPPAPNQRRISHEPVHNEPIHREPVHHEPAFEPVVEESDEVVAHKPESKKTKRPAKPKDPNAPKRVRKPKETKVSPKQKEPSSILDDAMDLQEDDDIGGIISLKKTPTDEAPVTSTPDSSFVMETDAEDGQRKRKRKLNLSRRGSINTGKNSLLASAVMGSAKKSAPSQLIDSTKEVRKMCAWTTNLLKNDVAFAEKPNKPKPIEVKPKPAPKPKAKTMPATNAPKLGSGLVDPKKLQAILAGFSLPKIK